MPAWVDRCVEKNKKDPTFKARYEKLKQEKGAVWTKKYPTLESFAWATCTVIYQRHVAKEGPTEPLLEDPVESVRNLIDQAMQAMKGAPYAVASGDGSMPDTPSRFDPPTLRVLKSQAPEALDDDSLSFTHIILHQFYTAIEKDIEIDGWTANELVVYHIRIVKVMEERGILHTMREDFDNVPAPTERR